MGILTAPAALRRIEYGVLLAGLIALAAWQRDLVGGWFWFWLLAPDLFGLLPASLMGTAPARGVLPPRGAWLYNATHNLVLPLVAIGVALSGQPSELSQAPWPLLGWLIHVVGDRTVGYGFRTADGHRSAP